MVRVNLTAMYKKNPVHATRTLTLASARESDDEFMNSQQLGYAYYS